MARREVVLVSKTATPAAVSGRANFNEIRVEVRVIFPPRATISELNDLFADATDAAWLETLIRQGHYIGEKL